MKKRILIVTIIIFMLLSLSACGSSATDTMPITRSIIEIPKTCVNGLAPSLMANADAYIELKHGDTIVKDEIPTEIVTISTTNGIMYICKTTGLAHIVR